MEYCSKSKNLRRCLSLMVLKMVIPWLVSNQRQRCAIPLQLFCTKYTVVLHTPLSSYQSLENNSFPSEWAVTINFNSGCRKTEFYPNFQQAIWFTILQSKWLVKLYFFLLLYRKYNNIFIRISMLKSFYSNF